MRHLVLLVLFMFLMASPAAASFDWLVLITESLIATDLWQTEEWYWATQDEPRITSVNTILWEGNPLIAGREWEQVESHIRLIPKAVGVVVPDGKIKGFVTASDILIRVITVVHNNNMLSNGGMSPRYMVAYQRMW